MGAFQASMLSVQNLWYRYGSTSTAWTVSEINLELASGELVGLLGPSGCGKTTLLRLIAGFEQPSCGSITLFGHSVASERHCVPAEQRGIGMVFQDGALFPHFTVWENACFGLKHYEARQRVQWLLDILGIAKFRHRYPHELSGGQRQRLALARSLAPAPKLLLLDEPFSNLDVEVRLHLRQELPAVLHECGVTAVMVTHDPEEALAICSRVGVMRNGRLLQLDAPHRLVDHPANSFVARFVLGANVVPVQWHQEQWHTCLGPLEPSHGLASEEQELMVPADGLKLQQNEHGRWRVQSREFLGHGWRYKVTADGVTISVIESVDRSWGLGDVCDVIWLDRQRGVLLTKTDGSK
jgi:iron(III) transport system ATP-binding protein